MTIDEAIKTFRSRKALAFADGYADRVQDYIEAMSMAIAALRAQQERENQKPQWISVKDRLPENEEDDVLIYCREIEHYGLHKEKCKAYHNTYKGAYDGERWYTNWCYGCKYIEDVNAEWPDEEIIVTHWMPLPEPPKEAQHDN